MLRHPVYDNATCNVLAWSSHAANVESAAEEEAGADPDEPPDSILSTHMKMSPEFQRTSVTRPKENHASLLTKALQSASEGESTENTPVRPTNSRRRRSITSDYSVASTAELTSDTGMSTRTNSPSPRLPNAGFIPVSMDKHHSASVVQIVGSLPRRSGPVNHVSQVNEARTEASKDPVVHTTEKKRCISFACAAKPRDEVQKAPVQVAPATTQTSQVAQPRKPCIKFACPSKPVMQRPRHSPPQREQLVIPKAEESGSASTVVNTPSTIRKSRSPVALRRSRPSTPRRYGQSPVVRKRKYLTADSRDLQGDLCRFHEFASDRPQEEDWIREEATVQKKKLTMDDLLKKENDIRRIGKEAEEEAELEEEEAEEETGDGVEDDDEDDDEDGDNVDEDEVEDNQSGYGSDDDFSDGYNTDEDLGFADSDDEEDDGLTLWTFTADSALTKISSTTPVFCPSSLGAHLSDSSTYSRNDVRQRHSQQRTNIPVRPMTPELPDSTDFVCGTMDEDRPLEEAYLNRLAARKQEGLRKIPQDIDPSFPTSDPEDDDEEELAHSYDSSEALWLHGEIEELHDERADRRRKRTEAPSPKRLRSPPPKRYHSPPPKARGRSPRRVFDRSSPKRIKSPAPVHHPKSPAVSPTHVPNGIGFNKSLATRPGLTHTKSLPRAAYFPSHVKSGRRTKTNTGTKDKTTTHVRAAIDIVKGLEQKRQRRKEKYHQKYCDRARKGQIPEKRAQPGEGAERMRELGLLLAGKLGQGNYVMSV